jgi:hypothetical protein
MQQELDAMGLDLEVQILGISEQGYPEGSIMNGRDIPWLQDMAWADIWTEWAVVYRDVIILDDNNVEILRYNLTSNSLSTQANYDALLGTFEDAATPSATTGTSTPGGIP